MDSKTRERIVVISGSIAFFLIAFLMLFVMPTMASIKKQTMIKAGYERDYAEVKRLLQEYQKKGGVTAAPRAFSGTLTSFVERKAKDIGITIALIKPYGDKREGVEIKVDELEGEKILRFVYEMENSGVTVNRLSMRDYRGTGLWTMKVYVEAGEEDKNGPATTRKP